MPVVSYYTVVYFVLSHAHCLLQNKSKSSFLNEGLLLQHIHSCVVKSLTWTRKLYLAKLYHKAVPTTDSDKTNLFQHLRKDHMKEYGEGSRMRSKKKELLGAQNKTESSVRTSQRWKEIIIAFAAIATFICKDTVLTQNVEKQGFLNWSKHLTCPAENTSHKSSCLIYIMSVGPKHWRKSTVCHARLQHQMYAQCTSSETDTLQSVFADVLFS